MADEKDPKESGAVAVSKMPGATSELPIGTQLLEIPGIDEPWPDDMAMAASLASEERLSSIWDPPEEDVSWLHI